MTKAPFSVEWLSQSSQNPSHLGHGDSETSTLRGDPRPQGLLGDPFSGSPATLGSEVPSMSSRPPELQAAAIGGFSSVKSWSQGEKASPEVSTGSCGLSESPGAEPHGRGARRPRTAFTTKQISTLERSFKCHHYLGAAERRKLASKMQLSEVQIKIWFQNRRMKLKRQLQDLRPPDPPPGFPLHLYSPLLLRSRTNAASRPAIRVPQFTATPSPRPCPGALCWWPGPPTSALTPQLLQSGPSCHPVSAGLSAERLPRPGLLPESIVTFGARPL